MPNILIIEDNEQLADIISQYLQKKGMTAHIAPDGVGALRSFAAGSYDLLLVDVRLPQMNGDEICRKIRGSAKGRNIPLIMMSGYVKDAAEIDRLKKELGLREFLVKPFSSDALYRIITATLQERPPEAPQPAPAAVAAPRPQPQPAGPRLPPPIKGELERTPFEQVLLYLLLKRGTGVLTVTSGTSVRKFSFLDGGPVELGVDAEQDDFGNYLGSKNLANSAELKVYEDRKKKGAEDPRDLFIKMGCLTPERFFEENRHFVHDRLLECFGWRTGSVLFEWKPLFPAPFPSGRVFMPSLFYRGFLAHLTPDRLRAFMEGKGNLYVTKTADFFEHRSHLAADAAGAELLDLINGTRTCAELAAALDVDDAVILLYTLDHLKIISFTPTPAPTEQAPPFPVRTRTMKPRKQEAETFEDLGGELKELVGEIGGLDGIKQSEAEAAAAPEAQSALEDALKEQWEAIRNKNYYEIFGMTPKTFSFDQLKKTYFELTKTYGPEKFFASSGEIMELAQEFLSRVANAYSTLSNVVSKENYDEILASQIPTDSEEKKFFEKVQFQSGKVMLEQGQYEGAEKAFNNCLAIDSDKAEYHAYLAFAMYHNPANRGNAAVIKKAKDLANKSLTMEKLPIAYALKGTMLLDEGMLNLAESEFNKALKLNPNNKIALKSMELIRQKREEENKGFFQRMFK